MVSRLRSITAALAIALLALPLDAAVLVKKVAPSCSEPTYLLADGFEANPGYDDAGWTTTTNVDPDYATSPAPLSGSQSLYHGVGASVGNLIADFGDAGNAEVYIAFEINFPSDPGGSSSDRFLQLIDVSNNVEICAVLVRNSYDGIELLARGGGSSVVINDSIVWGSTLRLKLRRWVDGSNQNNCEAWITTSTTDWGTSTGASTGAPGSFVANIDNYRLYHQSTAYDYIIDNVRIAASDIPICALD